MSYADRARPPRTLTEAEAKRLLSASGKRAAHYDDHVLFAIALGTGLRISEISALNCGDVYNCAARTARATSAKTRVPLREYKRSTDNPIPQEVMIGDSLRAKLDRFIGWKETRKQWLYIDSPLFSCVLGRPRKVSARTSTDYLCDSGAIRRLSKRRITERWHHWRAECGISDQLGFHALRHTFCQRLYDATGDLLLVKRAARHTSVMTTTIYAQASLDDVFRAVQGMEL